MLSRMHDLSTTNCSRREVSSRRPTKSRARGTQVNDSVVTGKRNSEAEDTRERTQATTLSLSRGIVSQLRGFPEDGALFLWSLQPDVLKLMTLGEDKLHCLLLSSSRTAETLAQPRFSRKPEFLRVTGAREPRDVTSGLNVCFSHRSVGGKNGSFLAVELWQRGVDRPCTPSHTAFWAL